MFSVVIPTYNRAAFLKELLDDVLGQTLPPAEVIVIDDGSTDGTADLLRQFGDRVRVLPGRRAGVQAARNAGVAAATQPYIALSDDDDRWLPGHLAAHAAVLREQPDLEFTFGNFRHLVGAEVLPATKFDEAPLGWWSALVVSRDPGRWRLSDQTAGATFRFHPIFPSASVVSRALWHRVGGYQPSLGHIGGEDGEFTLRCLYGGKVAAVPEVHVLIRKHAGNSSGQMAKRLLGEVQCLQFILREHPEAAVYRDVIEEQIDVRRLAALDGAFVTGDLASVRGLYPLLPAAARSAKVTTKYWISRCPDPWGRRLAAWATRR